MSERQKERRWNCGSISLSLVLVCLDVLPKDAKHGSNRSHLGMERERERELIWGSLCPRFQMSGILLRTFEVATETGNAKQVTEHET